MLVPVTALPELALARNLCKAAWADEARSSVSSCSMNRTATRAKSRTSSETVKVWLAVDVAGGGPGMVVVVVVVIVGVLLCEDFELKEMVVANMLENEVG